MSLSTFICQRIKTFSAYQPNKKLPTFFYKKIKDRYMKVKDPIAKATKNHKL